MTCIREVGMGKRIDLYNGDCLTVISKLSLDMRDCVFVSDPPFNIGYHYDDYDDRKNEDDYFSWLSSIFGDNKQVIIHSSSWLISIQSSHHQALLRWIMSPSGTDLSHPSHQRFFATYSGLRGSRS